MNIKVLFPRLRLTRELWTAITVAILCVFAASFLFYIGAKSISDAIHFKNVSEDLYFTVPAYMLIATGVLFLAVGMIGIISVYRDSSTLFALTLTIYLPILMLLAGSGMMAYTLRKDMPAEIFKKLRSMLVNYESDVPQASWAASPTRLNEKEELDDIQIQFQCCGIANFRDWVRLNPEYSIKNKDTSNGDINSYLPKSCCWGQQPCQNDPLNATTMPDTFVFRQGCNQPLTAELLLMLANMCAVATCYLFALLVILLGASILMCENSRHTYYLPVKPTSVTF